jgi:cytochrome d ubiquinol oxidase subunit II
MTLLLGLIWCSLTLYVVLAGADFGAGIWDLLAGSAVRGRPRRALIEHAIGPVWEANHVWLIFVLVLLWTVFPPVFASIASTLYIPLTLVAFGIIGRGAAFAFRKTSLELSRQRLFGATFAASSVLTPFFLGATAGAIASDRVPPGIAAGPVLASWLTPTSLLVGVLAVCACAFLAAVYLCGDAARSDPDVRAYFHRRAVLSGLSTGAVSLVGLVVLHHDAPALARGLAGRGIGLVLASVVAGAGALALVATRRYALARLAAAVAVAALLWGWGVARYPELLPGLSASQAVALPAAVNATLVVVLVGLVLLVPSMVYLFTLFQRGQARPAPVVVWTGGRRSASGAVRKEDGG